jgi:hypothetical protein
MEFRAGELSTRDVEKRSKKKKKKENEKQKRQARRKRERRRDDWNSIACLVSREASTGFKA